MDGLSDKTGARDNLGSPDMRGVNDMAGLSDKTGVSDSFGSPDMYGVNDMADLVTCLVQVTTLGFLTYLE